MVYVIFLCIALPLGLMLPILERRSRRLVFFLLLGMTTALVAYEVDTILYSLCGLDTVRFTQTVPPIVEEILKALPVLVFAVFLILLALYFLVVAKRVRLAPKPAAGVICGALCGVSAGLFAIGGPPMALYYVAAAEDHVSYLACMQFLFTVTGITGIVGRLYSGLLRPEILPYAAAGTVCILLGAVIGGRIAGKLNANVMRTVVYIFVGISGVILLAQQL